MWHCRFITWMSQLHLHTHRHTGIQTMKHLLLPVLPLQNHLRCWNPSCVQSPQAKRNLSVMTRRWIRVTNAEHTLCSPEPLASIREARTEVWNRLSTARVHQETDSIHMSTQKQATCKHGQPLQAGAPVSAPVKARNYNNPLPMRHDDTTFV